MKAAHAPERFSREGGAVKITKAPVSTMSAAIAASGRSLNLEKRPPLTNPQADTQMPAEAIATNQDGGRPPRAAASPHTSCAPMAAMSAASATVAHDGNSQIVAATSAIRTAPERTRTITDGRSGLAGADRRRNRAVAAVALLIFGNR